MDRIQILYLAFLLFATPFICFDSFGENVTKKLTTMVITTWKYSAGSFAALGNWKDRFGTTKANQDDQTCADYYFFLGQVHEHINMLQLSAEDLSENFEAITEQVTPLQRGQSEKLLDRQAIAFQNLLQNIGSLQDILNTEKLSASLNECSTKKFCEKIDVHLDAVMDFLERKNDILDAIVDLDISSTNIENYPKYISHLGCTQDSLVAFYETLFAIINFCPKEKSKS